ncbi:MerR family transcriptional regulator [Nocardia carnea]|uniref:MerR family transcriptional regulator n=1 Tax=Nocardia carnea TaxID=37328 RepID=UPI002454510B|nr:MerR family transcriptional regulator [Nocardia carnea]
MLRPARRSNGYRDYTESDITTVAHIRSLLAAGLTTTVIAGILHCVHGEAEELAPSPCPGMIAQLRREHARIEHAITRLQVSRQALDTLIAAAVPARRGQEEFGLGM